MKHYMDIQNLIETATEIKASNAGGFKVGDMIQITEKFDGANASIQFNSQTGKLDAFSRRMQLDERNTLNGFWEYTQSLDTKFFSEIPELIIFGEWSGARNKIVYNEEAKKKWYIFDIYDTVNEIWMPQVSVKFLAQLMGLEYIHELYNGPFISWDHVRSFTHSPVYGDTQEGVVVKNQTRLIFDNEDKFPFYLKVVNDEFKETKNKKTKEEDAVARAEREKAYALAETIVTVNRVEKMIYKIRDEGEIPELLAPTDMGLLAKILPKRVYEDCVKEEPETVALIEGFGKICGTLTMKYAREIICK